MDNKEFARLHTFLQGHKHQYHSHVCPCEYSVSQSGRAEKEIFPGPKILKFKPHHQTSIVGQIGLRILFD